MLKLYDGWRYAGDGKFWIRLASGKNKNPDFVCQPEKKIVEVFGRYWHRPEEEQSIKEAYKKDGWECLVVWEDQTANLVDRFESFAGYVEEPEPMGVSVFDYDKWCDKRR